MKNFTAGRLSNHVSQWKKLTHDKHVIETVKGLQIEFDNRPFQSFIPNEYKYTEDEITFLESEIVKLQNKKVIEQVEPIEGQYVSNIFLRDKKDGSYRMILNLKKLNLSVEYHHFKMETLKSAINLMTRNCYMASIDFKDAYYSIPVYKPHRKFLRFQFQGKLYEFTCLPNGLSSGPRLFTKVTKPMFATLRVKGLLNTIYIDDSLLFGENREECRINVMETARLAIELGFVLHPEKSIFEPTQIIEFLGFILNSVDMTVKLTERKATIVKEMCLKLLGFKKPSIRTVAVVVGKMVSSFPGVEYGPLFHRYLDNEKTLALKNSAGNFEAKMRISEHARSDLNWWVNNIQSAYCPVSHGRPDVTVYSDASKTAWGGARGPAKTGGNWSSAESEIHINVLELMAALYILSSLCNDVYNSHIRLMIDNQTAVAYINKMGGKKSQCNRVAREIWDWARKRNIWLSAAYLTSKANYVADEQSRINHNNAEWEINDQIFEKLTDIWGVPEIDLFASRLNHKVKRYYSFKPDPFSEGVDAFTIDWGKNFNYIFPPFALVGKILQKLEEDKGTAIIIMPYWTTQSWFSKMIHMLTDCPFSFNRTTHTMRHPQKQSSELPRMSVIACRLSGNPSEKLNFQTQLNKSSCRHGDDQQHLNTTLSSRDGHPLRLRGKSVPIHRL